MTKKIAVINDLSGLGRCSLTAAISVIAAMGIQPCPLPTAVLSAQTGYPSYYLDNYTDKMDFFRTEWAKLGQHFDGIYTGFVAGETQIQRIFDFIGTFRTPDTFLLVDPVMGDDGKKYDMFTPRLLAQMKRLAKEADIITPNITELCLLTDMNYHDIKKITDVHALTTALQKAAEEFCEEGPEHVIITGIHFTDESGVHKMGNFCVSRKKSSEKTGKSISKTIPVNSFTQVSAETFLSAFPYIGESYSGTGDLFASCIAAGAARGDSLPDMIQTAGKFIEASIADAAAEKVPRNDGVNYEKYLSMLM